MYIMYIYITLRCWTNHLLKTIITMCCFIVQSGKQKAELK